MEHKKTPVSILQEFCLYRGLTADYTLISVEGQVHEPTFTFRVEVDHEFAIGVGQSKKKAKHAAAKALLDKLQASDKLIDSSLKLLENLSLASDLKEKDDSSEGDKFSGNHVGTLQELCMKRQWEPPYYETVLEEGLPHDRVFGIQCQVKMYDQGGSEDKEIKKTGFGRTKRIAKHQAAYKILQVLEGVYVCDEKPPVKPTIAQSQMKTKTQKSSVPIPDYGHKVRMFFQELQSSPGKTLASLHVTDLSMSTTDFIGLLQDVADEQNFQNKYCMLENSRSDGNQQCLVHLGALPAMICFGMGKSSDDAKEDAAKNALHILEIITRT
ncbi:interferon-inducible double-stranded RNA-dependent protein kinase activator A homolog [Limulus polyphemus]|uniref:Interferon-inducible double-stranded RNA-dependent protein kinase activator A homolog n=1 Tax=Limulus polyphemus TaxID=6850 RepID=A0ABM1BV01_LIMPO|nr:interferon-inducible double-stranded RNA-dependent protein kinase activator A homolog [Limulus polyphemus]